MKLRLLGLTVVMIASVTGAMAQFNGTGLSGGIGYGVTVANTELNDATRFIARGFLRKGITDNFMAELGLASAKIGGDGYNTLMFPIDLRLNFSPFNFESWNPFIYGGYGVMNYKVEDKPAGAYKAAKLDGWAGFIPVGAGVQFKFLDNANFEVVGGYNPTRSADLNATRSKDGGMDKYWTLVFNLSSTLHNGLFDSDGDGLSDDMEKQLGTNPKLADTDGDGLSDGEEVNRYKTDPKLADSDGDGLTDKQEVAEYHTDPNLADTDGDGIKDGDEVLKYHTDALKKDTDGDSLTDGDEILKYHTDPLKIDTDGGSVSDGDEVKRGTNPVLASDDVPPAPKEEAKAPEPKEDKIASIETGESLTLEGILFETGKADITEGSKSTLDKVVATLQGHPEIALEVQGHTDNKGKEATNKKLSQKRADSVRAYLVAHGIDGNRLTAKGFGSSKPVESNDTDAGRQKNRRIEFLRTK